MQLDKLKETFDPTELADLSISEDDLCQRYERLYTAAVSDALREQPFMNQALPPEIRPIREETCVAGIAFTVTCSSEASVDGQVEMKTRAELLETMSEHSICVWNAGNNREAGQWGEMTTAGAKQQGCKGVVVNGGIRDTRQILELEFPAFCRYRTPNGTVGRTRIKSYQTPTKIDRVLIRPGDVVFGDIDGVIVVPRESAVEVLERAEEIQSEDRQVREEILDGDSTARDIVDAGGYF